MSMVVAVNNIFDDETTESLWILFVTPSISSIPAADLVEQAVHETLTYYGLLAEDPDQQSAGADHERDPA
jgi:hypothetical protein